MPHLPLVPHIAMRQGVPSHATKHVLPQVVSIDKRHRHVPRVIVLRAFLAIFAAMHAGHVISLISSLLWLVQLTSSQNIQTFCNRLYHSIVVANDRLYVDGGELRTVRTFSRLEAIVGVLTRSRCSMEM